jgi:uncharacterized OB-fold protein
MDSIIQVLSQQVKGNVTKKYWQDLNDEKFMYQICDDCNSSIFYPRVVCPTCMSESLSWHQASGTGKIYSFTVVYRTVDPRFKSETPYVVGLIDLDEGIRVMGNIIGWEDPEGLLIDQTVEIKYKKLSEEYTLPVFKVVSKEGHHS